MPHCEKILDTIKSYTTQDVINTAIYWDKTWINYGMIQSDLNKLWNTERMNTNVLWPILCALKALACSLS